MTLGTLADVDTDRIAEILAFEDPRPFSVLGPKRELLGGRPRVTVRAFLPRATEAWVMARGRRYGMVKVADGFFVATLDSRSIPKIYTVNFTDSTGYQEEREDPYSFRPSLNDYDRYLIGEGTHRKSYEKLGAHLVTRAGVKGVRFSVWAPNAKAVSVIGDFNHWMAGAHPMERRGVSGIWELFVPRLSELEPYKFAVKSLEDGRVVEKTDPYAFDTEMRPKTAARVRDVAQYAWGDEQWMTSRREGGLSERPVSVYEVHLGSWMKREGAQKGTDFLTYRELAERLIPYAKEMGFTHLELMPVMEHPLDDSWGYQVVNYFAPTSRFGEPSDFMFFIDRCHQNGLGVILDWVPGHFPRDDHGLGLFDGTHLYEHADPRKGLHPEWGTYIFNLGRREVQTFLISNALFWLSVYHADGLRIDAVASMLYLDYARKEGEWLPNEFGGRENLEAVSFLRELNKTVHSECPGAVVIAEESTSWPGVTRPVETGGLGFDMKWNMGWMHDTLEYFSTDPIFRKHIQGKLTFAIWYAFSEKFLLVLSHDEVVYGKRSMLEKMSGDEWRRFANLRALFGYMFASPGKKLLFMGNEFGQTGEWDFRSSLAWDESRSPMHEKLRSFVKDLNRLYLERKEMHELDFSPDGFEWVDFADVDQSIITFLRRSKDGGALLFAFNMTPVPRFDYQVGVPAPGFYREVLNSDALEYGGSGMGNMGGVWAQAVPWNRHQQSLRITLPPLSVVAFEPEPTRAQEQGGADEDEAAERTMSGTAKEEERVAGEDSSVEG